MLFMPSRDKAELSMDSVVELINSYIDMSTFTFFSLFFIFPLKTLFNFLIQTPLKIPLKISILINYPFQRNKSSLSIFLFFESLEDWKIFCQIAESSNLFENETEKYELIQKT